MKRNNNPQEIQCVGQKRPLPDNQFVFEYWARGNRLQAIGEEWWVDEISRLIMRTKDKG